MIGRRKPRVFYTETSGFGQRAPRGPPGAPLAPFFNKKKWAGYILIHGRNLST